uniref:Uncharacterized protein n=1 Tax=Proboscia inermis TaxID=420281 RepID=A0A7S0GAM0_9STRA|mmetsp:Transcript_26354/g.26748  ORF Transcript_26354/g.26748 Transcript_26354/m.26748 type:complete len:163 (+) Transcript_26354:1258-1746(+)
MKNPKLMYATCAPMMAPSFVELNPASVVVTSANIACDATKKKPTPRVVINLDAQINRVVGWIATMQFEAVMQINAIDNNGFRPKESKIDPTKGESIICTAAPADEIMDNVRVARSVPIVFMRAGAGASEMIALLRTRRNDMTCRIVNGFFRNPVVIELFVVS